MAKLSEADILKLAQLSRLHLSKEEVNKFKQEIGSILEYVEQLQSVDSSGVMPTFQVTGLKNVMRPDIVKDYGVTTEELLKNVPATQEGHIKVKRMLA